MNFILSYPKSHSPLEGFSGDVLGKSYAATTGYLTKDGKPYICRMGEFHYSRYDDTLWEEELIKMRDGGIDVIASYIFWIHHEECEGEFDFEGRRDVGKFISICKKLGLPFVLRVGPWVHAEARNGGFPDWLPEKAKGKLRTLSEPYMSYVRRFFEKLYKEVEPHLDAILAIQIENELRHEREYALALKKMLLEIGYRAPLWTFTGWGGSDSPDSCPGGEVLCLYGGYPEAPWMQHLDPIGDVNTYNFLRDRDDENIGADILKASFSDEEKKNKLLINNTPYLTCELGGGNQITYHRRPIISAEDILAIAICKLGGGANGLGYYVYHGGLNPIGKKSYMQESRETGYPNDLPLISYDFQAPLGEAGQIRQSYFELQRLHSFIELCGEELATMPPYFSDYEIKLWDVDTLRAAVRSDGERGFVFINNHFHLGENKHLSDIINLKLTSGETLSIPISCEPHAIGVFPFRFSVGGITLDWISATPHSKDGNIYYFSRIHGIEPILSIDGKTEPVRKKMTIGDAEIRLIDEPELKATSEEPIKVTYERTVDSHDFFSHVRNLDGTRPEANEAAEYTFTLPSGTRYVKIRGVGNVGALYHGDSLICDWYFFGRDWTVDVHRIKSGEKLTLRILPLTKKDKSGIYLETDMPVGAYAPKVAAISENSVFELN